MSAGILKTEIIGKYKGPEHPLLTFDVEYELIMLTSKATPAVHIELHDGKHEIGYPSKKQFLEHWEIEKQVKVVRMPNVRGKKKDDSKTTITEAGAIIYTEIVNSVNRFNARMAHTYKENESWKKPEFEIRLVKQVYDEATQKAKNVYGAGVVEIEVKQFGLKRLVYSQGVSFRTEKELDNTNAYAPKLYLDAFDTIVESALLYVLALNPDNPENVEALKEVKAETVKKNGRKSKKAVRPDALGE